MTFQQRCRHKVQPADSIAKRSICRPTMVSLNTSLPGSIRWFFASAASKRAARVWESRQPNSTPRSNQITLVSWRPDLRVLSTTASQRKHPLSHDEVCSRASSSSRDDLRRWQPWEYPNPSRTEDWPPCAWAACLWAKVWLSW